MSTKTRCVYCEKRFEPSHSTEEHLVLRALGGKRTSRTIVCAECNNRLGSEIDSSLPKELELVRAIVGIPRTDPPTVHARGAYTGRTYRIFRGGQRELLTVECTKTSETFRDAGELVSFEITGAPQKVHQIVKGIERKYGKLRIRNADEILYNEPLAPCAGTVILGTTEQSRSIMKMILNVLAALGDDFGIPFWIDPLQAAREFVATGRERISLPVALDRRPLLLFPPARDLAFQNRILVVADPAVGTIVAAMEILGALKYTVLVAQEYDGPLSGLLFTNLPLERGPDTVEPVYEIRGIAAEELLDRGSYEERLAVCEFYLEKLLRMTREYDLRRFIASHVVPEAARAAGGEELTPETLDKFAAEAAEKLVWGMLPPGRFVRRRLQSTRVAETGDDEQDLSGRSPKNE